MRPTHQKKGTGKKLVHDTRAVSEVLGFMVIMGIVVTAMSMYLALQVPEWTKEFEAEHAVKVSHDFAQLDSAIDLTVLRADNSTAIETGIGMAAARVPLIGPGLSGGSFMLEPARESLEIIAGALEANGTGNSSCWYCSPQNCSPSPANNTLCNFSLFPAANKVNVVTLDRGVEIALEIGTDKIFASGHDEYLAGEYWYNNFVVTNGTTVYTSSLVIHALNITIDAGSAINADSGGAAGAKINYGGNLSNRTYNRNKDEAKGPGRGGSPDNFSAGGGGAGYGGDGGKGNISRDGGAGGSGGDDYGVKDSIGIDDTGSGGGCGRSGIQVPGIGWFTGGEGGDGGGTVYLDAPIITVAGTISANGSAGSDGEYTSGRTAYDSAAGGGGGGSGGAIMLQGNTVTLSGILYALGGNGGNGGNATQYGSTPNNGGGGGGGGAGGRIKVFYETAFNCTAGDILHAKVGSGTGGRGGIAKDGSTWYNGSNGDPGENGTTNNHTLPYTPPIFHYDAGYLTSPVYNVTTPLVRYGTLSWNETVDADTNIIMKVRTSAVASMNETTGFALPWEECPEVSLGQDISELSSVSDGHQYIQWRAELVTFDLTKTPILHDVNISFEYGTPFLVTASGALTYSSNYHYLPDFVLDYAHGATIKEQQAGEFMLFSPAIAIRKEGNTTFLKVTATDLTGGNESTQGALRTTIRTTYQDAKLLTGGLNFLNLSMTLTTAHPETWGKWFNDTCRDAGLNYGSQPGEYSINQTENFVRIIFYGDESKPVNLWLKRAGVQVEPLRKWI